MTTFKWNFFFVFIHITTTMSWGPFLPLPLCVWAWDKCRLVSRKTSEEVFFMTRNKKDKSSRCHRKWDTGVWDDGGLKSRTGDDTALPLISEQKSIYNRQKKTDAINLEAVNYLRESGSPAWYLRRGRCRSASCTFAQMVAVLGQHSNKKRGNERLLLCSPFGLSVDECRRW